MKYKNSYLLSKGQLQEVIDKLVARFGLPEVRRELAMYITQSDGSELHFLVTNSRVFIRLLEPDAVTSSQVYIASTRNLKQLIKIATTLGSSRGHIGTSIGFNFCDNYKESVDIMLDSFVGDFLRVRHNGQIDELFFSEVTSKLELLTLKKQSELINSKKINDELLLDDLQVLHPKIVEFCDQTGIISTVVDRSIKNLLKVKSNDYSAYEHAASLLDIDLLSRQALEEVSLYKPVSIISPFFNTSENLLKFLLAIESQDLPKEALAQTEVILVDDGSDISLSGEIKKICNERNGLSFKLTSLRLDNNKGRSVARNVGAALAQNDILVFLDSDILLAKNYLLEHSIRNQLIPNAVFVTFKENVTPSSDVISQEALEKGLPNSNYRLDSRIHKDLDDSSMGLYQLHDSSAVDILSDTDYFKKFGYGRSVGIYDLPAMVTGHNFSCRKSEYHRVGGFSEAFTGWGMEDSYFGALMIKSGCFVIPVLSTGVYHIDHPPRSGSDEMRRRQLQENLDTYNRLVSEIHY